MYATDWDETLCPAESYCTDVGDTGYSTWPSWLGPYIKNWDILKCPTNPDMYTAYWAHGGVPQPIYCGYGINNITNWPADTPMGRWVNVGPGAVMGTFRPALSKLDHPAETIDFADSYATADYRLWAFWAPETDWVNSFWFYDLTDVPGTANNAVGKRHQEGANFAFCDGHAKWLRQTTQRMWAAKDLP